jgi:Family of unknown function (DUF5985)
MALSGKTHNMNLQEINLMLAGATTLAGCTIALFFWRFWRKTGDRLFIFFAIAFLLLGIEHLCIGFFGHQVQALVYLIRLAAFLLIVYAIIDKNRKQNGS